MRMRNYDGFQRGEVLPPAIIVFSFSTYDFVIVMVSTEEGGFPLGIIVLIFDVVTFRGVPGLG